MRFKHIEPPQTFSNYILKHSEPHRTFSNFILTERARFIDFFHTSSGWFDWTEPSLPTSLQGIQPRTSSNLLELHPHRAIKVGRLPLHEFGVVRLNRTFSDCIFTGDRRSEGALCQKAPCTPSSHCKAVVRKGSVQSNHPELV